MRSMLTSIKQPRIDSRSSTLGMEQWPFAWLMTPRSSLSTPSVVFGLMPD